MNAEHLRGGPMPRASRAQRAQFPVPFLLTRFCCFFLAGTILGLAFGSQCYADFGTNLLVDLPGGDFNSQMYTSIQHAPGRPNDLFISRADGTIFRYDLTTNTQSTFLTLPASEIDAGGGYWGLLGFTFAPDFGTS